MEKKEQKIQKVGRKKTIVYGPFECTNCTSKNVQILDTEQWIIMLDANGFF